jgi:tetratricopeptide (TPR) repeat protein
MSLGETVEAEKLTVQLVEQEPSNYHKLVELVEIYSKKNDLESAVRVLSIASEYLLTGGQSVDFLKWTNEILARNPENIDALRMLVRYHTWQRDEGEVKNSLERLVETAQVTENFEEERDALARLMMMYPRESKYAERMHELKVKYNLDDSMPQFENLPVNGEGFENSDEDFESNNLNAGNFQNTEQFAQFDGDVSMETDIGFQTFRDIKPEDLLTANDGFDKSNGHVVEMEALSENGFQITDASGFQTFGNGGGNNSSETLSPENSASQKSAKLNLVDELRLNKEIESIEFYINQEYIDIAVKSFVSLKEEFGVREEYAHLERCLADKMPEQVETPEVEELPESLPEAENTSFENDSFEIENFENFVSEDTSVQFLDESPSSDDNFDEFFEMKEDELSDEMSPIELDSDENSTANVQNLFDDFRSELGLEEPEEIVNESDYDTHYQTAIVYKEMGLMEDAIKEFQNAINLVEINDGTRKFFQCANLLGHCFMVKEMPTLAITWFNRAFETADLNDNEVLALNYELANSYEFAKDFDKAIEYFEMIYAEDVEYRDVSDRLETLKESLVGA